MVLAYYRTRREPDAYFYASKRYNPGRQVVIDMRTHDLILPIAAGTGDAVDVYRHAGMLIVVAVNARMEYAGIEVFTVDGEAIGEVFAQGAEQVREYLGPRGTELASITIARRMLEYVN